MANISKLIIYEPLDSFTEKEQKSWVKDGVVFVRPLEKREKPMFL